MAISKDKKRLNISVRKDTIDVLNGLQHVFKNKTFSMLVEEAVFCYALAIADTFKNVTEESKEDNKNESN